MTNLKPGDLVVATEPNYYVWDRPAECFPIIASEMNSEIAQLMVGDRVLVISIHEPYMFVVINGFTGFVATRACTRLF